MNTRRITSHGIEESPLESFLKKNIGFQNIFEDNRAKDSYPPYNIIEKSENNWDIEIAVAGISADEIDISFDPKKSKLSVQRKSPVEETVQGETGSSEAKSYLYKGIAKRAFIKEFILSEHVKVNDATVIDGILKIDLIREIPESAKPVNIPINRSERQILMEEKASTS